MSLELNLAGKTAIVTGGSAGIGFATAKALYSEGVSVAITAQNPERLEKAANAIRELPDRGLFRTEYEGRTLRENLGLSRPANQFSSKVLTPLS